MNIVAGLFGFRSRRSLRRTTPRTVRAWQLSSEVNHKGHEEHTKEGSFFASFAPFAGWKGLPHHLPWVLPNCMNLLSFRGFSWYKTHHLLLFAGECTI